MTVSSDDIASQATPSNGTPRASVIVPTYKEIESLPHLLQRVQPVAESFSGGLEVLIVDDDSQDGSEEYVNSLGLSWIRFIKRTKNRGLSPAVIDGFREASGVYLVCMDADLSHPPEKIPELIRELDAGASFVIGSRYVEGASTDETWSLLRRLNSWGATMMARPFTKAADPMSGFFALRKADFDRAKEVNPVGYKIGLELLVKCGGGDTCELPIHFVDRRYGTSKLSFAEQLKYVQHIRRLFIYRYPELSHFFQFAVVGASGVLVNLAVLTLLLAVGMPVSIAYAVAVSVSMLSNFALNRRLSFSYARHRPVLGQLIGFILACALGALVNYGVTLGLLRMLPGLAPQLAALVGIAVGMGINFLFSRFAVFRKTKSGRST